jgi:hypothetical protein
MMIAKASKNQEGGDFAYQTSYTLALFTERAGERHKKRQEIALPPLSGVCKD